MLYFSEMMELLVILENGGTLKAKNFLFIP